MAFIIPESAGRISEFCMHFACDFTGGAAHYTIPASIVDFQHDCPLHNSLCKLWTQGSYKLRPFQHTARSGNIWSHFSVNSATLVATASSFFLFTVDLRFLLTFAGACVLLRNQFVVGGPRRRDYSAPPAVFRLSHSGRHWTRIRSIHTTCRVPHKASNAQWNDHSSQASKDARSQRTANTRTLPTSRFPNGECSLQNKAKWYNDYIPITATH